VVDALLGRLDVAVQHGAVRAQAGAVHRARDRQPLLARDLEVVALAMHALGEDLGAAARDRAQAGLDQLGQDLGQGPLGLLRDLVQLDHREGLDVDRGPRALHGAQDVEVVAVLELGMDAGHHVHLGDRLGELRR
jgi:hypothetical protein